MPPSLKMIETGLKLAEEGVAAVSPDLGKALVANLPEIFGGEGKLDKALFNKALELAPNDFIKKQLVEMRDLSTNMREARISNIASPSSSIAEPSRAQITSMDGTVGSAFLHTKPLSTKYFAEGDRVPTQLIGANLFNTVQPSMVRELSFSADMYGDPTVLKREGEKLNAAYLKSMKDKGIYDHHFDIIEGRRVNVIVSKDAGPPLAEKFAGSWYRCPELTKQAETSPELRTALHKALIDREIIGDTDGNIGNFTFTQPDGKPNISNIDFEYAFRAGSQPRLRKIFNEPLLLGQKLEPPTTFRIGQFVDAYSTSPGRQLLADLGMQPAHIDGVLNRAQWFADKKTLPVLTDTQ
jgi:hypothetical protein